MALVVTLLLAAASGLLPTGSLQTVAGSGRGFPGNPGFAGDGGPATQARLARPAQVSADRRGGFYIADSSNQRIRYVSRTGRIQTIAGSGRQGDCGEADAWLSGTDSANASPPAASALLADPNSCSAHSEQ